MVGCQHSAAVFCKSGRHHGRHQIISSSATGQYLAYLLKRDAKLEPEDEDLEKLDKRRSKAEIQIKPLETQLKASLPKGRDLTGQIQAEALIQSVQSPPWMTKLTAPGTPPSPENRLYSPSPSSTKPLKARSGPKTAKGATQSVFRDKGQVLTPSKFTAINPTSTGSSAFG